MANMYDITPISYKPSEQMDWFVKSIFGGRLIEKGRITPLIGVKDGTLLNLLEVNGDILQADNKNCGWTPEQIAKLSEKELRVKTYKVNLEQCLDELETNRIAHMMKPGARNTELPDTLEEATMLSLAKKLSKEIERKIFTGDSSVNTNDFDGVTKKLKGSTTCIKVVGVALTKTNILEEIEKTFVTIPEDVLSKAGETEEDGEGGTLYFAMSFKSLQKVKMALGGVYGANVVVSPNFTITGDTVRYMGVELISVIGIGENDFVVYDASNFILGTDLLSDLEDIRLGQFPAPQDNKIFIDGRLRLGFEIAFEDEVVYYSPDNTTPQGFAARTLASTTTGGEKKEYAKTAQTVIAEIKAAQTIEEIDSLIEGDERKTVNDEANKRKAEIQANSTTTGGE